MMRPSSLFVPALLLLASPAAAQPLVILDGGVAVLTSPDGSQLAVGPDAADTVHDYDGQAGWGEHLRLSRVCAEHASPLASTCDFSNPWAKDFTLGFYRYGVDVSYAGLLEMNLGAGLSIHSNNAACAAAFGCNHAGQVWVGDELDEGGLYLTAHRAADGAWVTLAADLWPHTSHGDMRLTVRNPADKVAVFAGNYGAEAEVASFSGTGALVCRGPVTTPALALASSAGSVQLIAAPDGLGLQAVLADGSTWAVQLAPVAPKGTP